MKKRLGHLISGNFYTYTLYKVTDAKGRVVYLAEPKGAGATRNATSVEELQEILDADVAMLNLIARESTKRIR